MALRFRNRSAPGFVGLDIDGSFVAAVQMADGKIERARSAELEPGLVDDGEVADADRLSDALKDFFGREGLPRNVRLGVANQKIVVRHLEMPRLTDKAERDAAVRFQTAEAVAMPLEEAVVDYHVVGERGTAEGTVRDRVVVVAARRSMISSLLDAVRGAGLKPDGVDLSAFALIRTLGGDSSAEQSARAYCHLGGVTNLAIARGSSCLFTRPLAADWAEDGVQALADELRLSIEYHLAQPDAPPVADVVLSGPGARTDGIAERLSDVAGLPVSVAEPLGPLGAVFLDDDDPYRHTVSVGLALGAVG
jgi:type IV pilus assembly protein PilM